MKSVRLVGSVAVMFGIALCWAIAQIKPGGGIEPQPPLKVKSWIGPVEVVPIPPEPPKPPPVTNTVFRGTISADLGDAFVQKLTGEIISSKQALDGVIRHVSFTRMRDGTWRVMMVVEPRREERK